MSVGAVSMDSSPNQETRRHLELRKRGNSVFAVMLLPCASYFIWPAPIVLWVGLAYLIGGSAYLHFKRRELYDEYARSDRKLLERFEIVLAERGIGLRDSRLGYAYRERSGEFTPVLVCRSGEFVYFLENPFSKRCTYVSEPDMTIVLEMSHGGEFCQLNRRISGEVRLEPLGCSHRDLLIAKQNACPDRGAIEYFMYDAVLREMLARKVRKPLHVSRCLCDMSRETVYALCAAQGDVFYIPAKTAERLGLMRADPKAKKNPDVSISEVH